MILESTNLVIDCDLKEITMKVAVDLDTLVKECEELWYDNDVLGECPIHAENNCLEFNKVEWAPIFVLEEEL